MRTLLLLTGLVLLATVVSACGEKEHATRPAPYPVAALAARQAQLDQDPYDLRCADLADKVASARMTRRVQYALADDAAIPGLDRLRASQSIFFAITELCKDQPGSYRPARPAIAGVRAGDFVADLSSP